MTITTMLLVSLGAVIGAPLRYLVERVVPRGRRNISWGLLIVNVVGSFIAGIAAARLTGAGSALVLIGFCGSLTTFSGFSLELSDQLSIRKGGAWLVTVTSMLVGTISAFAVAYALFRP